MKKFNTMKIINNKKIFLGGTCPSNKGDFDYRELLIPYLEKYNMNYFNPVVCDWTPKARENEEIQKKECKIHLYVISPNTKGMYSIAEAFSTFVKYSDSRVILCFIDKVDNKTFDYKQIKSNRNIENLFNECIAVLNKHRGCFSLNLPNEEHIDDLVKILVNIYE
jgi:hypothetical protein